MHSGCVAVDDEDDFVRLPGMFPRWDLEQVVEVGHSYRIEEAGRADNGVPLFFVYRRTDVDAATQRTGDET